MAPRVIEDGESSRASGASAIRFSLRSSSADGCFLKHTPRSRPGRLDRVRCRAAATFPAFLPRLHSRAREVQVWIVDRFRIEPTVQFSRLSGGAPWSYVFPE